jgi:hypothetical protein
MIHLSLVEDTTNPKLHTQSLDITSKVALATQLHCSVKVFFDAKCLHVWHISNFSAHVLQSKLVQTSSIELEQVSLLAHPTVHPDPQSSQVKVFVAEKSGTFVKSHAGTVLGTLEIEPTVSLFAVLK